MHAVSDEDLRADRQPEFTQIDIEMSFSTIKDIIIEIEGLVSHIFKEVLGREIVVPFEIMPYREAMERFGSDRPDNRFGMEIVDISEIAGGSQFKVFQSVLQKGGVVKGINVEGCGHFSRKELDDLTQRVQRWGTGGLAWMIVTGDGFKHPLPNSSRRNSRRRSGQRCCRTGICFFCGRQWEAAPKVLGQLRLFLAQRLNIIPEGKDSFLWVVDFPLLEYDQAEGRYTSNHHPLLLRKEDLASSDYRPSGCSARL